MFVSCSHCLFHSKVKDDKSKVDLSEAEKMEIVKHLSQNHEKYYGRLTGLVGLPQQKKFWEDLANSYSKCNVTNGYHLKEMVRVWIKRANERFDKTCGRTGASGDVQLNEFQTACRQLQRIIKGDAYLDGIQSEQSSGTSQSSKPVSNIGKANPERSKSVEIVSTSTMVGPEPQSSSLTLPKPSKPKRMNESESSTLDVEISSPSKVQMIHSLSKNQEKLSELKYDRLSLERERLNFEREKWELEKKLIEQTIEEKRYKGMYYYLKCQQLMKSTKINLKEINNAYDLFGVPIFEEFHVQEDDKSESVSSTTSNSHKDKEYDPMMDLID